MDIRTLTPAFSVAPQITPDEVAELAAKGFRTVVCNRPDGEGPDQPNFAEITRACRTAGLEAAYLPVAFGTVGDEDARTFGQLLDRLPKPALAFCRTGARSATLWSLSKAARGRPLSEIPGQAKALGHDMDGVARRVAHGGRMPTDTGEIRHEVVVVGGGAAGIAVASSLKARKVHQVLLLEELQCHGCEVRFLDRPMSQDPHDQLLLQIRGAVAEYERTLITELMRRGRRRKLEAGLMLPWTRAPFGYRVDPDRPRDPAGIRIEEGEAAIVREMFAWYADEAHSFCSLARLLEQRGIRTSTGLARWNLASIRGLLTNPAYAGKVYGNRWHRRSTLDTPWHGRMVGSGCRRSSRRVSRDYDGDKRAWGSNSSA